MKIKERYDVIVVGGGAAGFAAALGAKKAGADVLLIERAGCLGGQATNSNVASYCGFFTREENEKQIVFGIGDEVLQKLREMDYYEHHRKSPVGNSIAIPICLASGGTLSAAAISSMIGMGASYAFILPPAHPNVAIAIGSGWTTTAQVITYGTVLMICAVLASVFVGYPLAAGIM